MENPIEMDDLGGTTIFGNTSYNGIEIEQFSGHAWNIDLTPHQFINSKLAALMRAPWHLAQVPQRWNWQVLQLYLATVT